MNPRMTSSLIVSGATQVVGSGRPATIVSGPGSHGFTETSVQPRTLLLKVEPGRAMLNVRSPSVSSGPRQAQHRQDVPWVHAASPFGAEASHTSVALSTPSPQSFGGGGSVAVGVNAI